MATITLRPNANGNTNELASQSPDSDFHFDKVDEVTKDDMTTICYEAGVIDATELFGLEAMPGASAIASVTVYAWVYTNLASNLGGCRIKCRTHSTDYEDDRAAITTSTWELHSHTWTDNPNTTNPWTKAEVDALEAGARMDTAEYDSNMFLTQVYVVVDYTPAAVGRSFGVIIG